MLPVSRKGNGNQKERCMSTVVRGAVMIWTAGMLTAHYVGFVHNMDATFVAGLFTSTLATFGVTTTRRDDEAQQPQQSKQKNPPAQP